MQECKVEGCSQPIASKKTKLCHKHHLRYIRYGTTELTRQIVDRSQKCIVEGCERTRVTTLGYCLKHYKEWKRRQPTDTTKNVQFAVNQLGTLDVMECVVSITPNGEDTEIHYIGKNDYLNPMEIKGVNIIKHKTESGFIKSLLKRYWEENSCQTKSYITSILINWIIAKAIYMCVKITKNTPLYIDSWSELRRNSLIWELSSLQMGNIGGVSNSSAYKMLGNGWTVDVIAHLIKSTLKENINDS